MSDSDDGGSQGREDEQYDRAEVVDDSSDDEQQEKEKEQEEQERKDKKEKKMNEILDLGEEMGLDREDARDLANQAELICRQLAIGLMVSSAQATIDAHAKGEPIPLPSEPAWKKHVLHHQTHYNPYTAEDSESE